MPDIDFLFDADCPSHEQALAWQRRVRVLVAAEVVFKRHGVLVPTDDVARAAGVDIGTVLHHFPTKEALVEAVLVARLERLRSEAEDLAGEDDAGAAFHDFCASVVQGSRTKLPLVDVLDSAAFHGSTLGRALAAALDPLLRRAQAAGDVRADVDVTDVMALLVGCSHAVQHAAGSRDGLRILAIVRDGLRPRR